MKIIPGKKFIHKKGGLYEVIALARSSNDCKQELVVYESLEDSDDFPRGTVWVRSRTEFETPGRFTPY